MDSAEFNAQHNTTAADTSRCCLPLGLPLLFEPNHKSTMNRQEDDEPMDDARLAREFNELSFEEREEVFDDIHAVAKPPAETPEILAQGLKEMDEALGGLVPKRRKNLNRALFLCPRLEQDKKFKLMFLRAELYDPVQAADRMARYYDMKCELFGEEKVADRITIKDLTNDDLLVIKSGYCIVLPTKDPAGRPLIFLDQFKMDFRRFEGISALRCLWYLTMSVSYDDEMAQKMGICGIMYTSGGYLEPDRIPLARLAVTTTRSGNMLTALPVRFSCMRICSERKGAARLDLFIRTFRMSIGKFARLRLTTHVGSDLEIEYMLMSVGICRCGELFRNSRKGITTQHEAFVKKRLEIDIQKDVDVATEETESGLIFYPNPNDVLVGRGAPYKFFPGNQRWEQLIQSNVKRYRSSSNFEKTCSSLEMVKAIKEGDGGRFLQRTQQGWKCLDDNACREKAVRAFRTRMKSSG